MRNDWDDVREGWEHEPRKRKIRRFREESADGNEGQQVKENLRDDYTTNLEGMQWEIISRH